MSNKEVANVLECESGRCRKSEVPLEEETFRPWRRVDSLDEFIQKI
jgi:hypothetical protein